MIIDRVYNVDTTRPLTMRTMADALMAGDRNAHRIVINVTDREVAGTVTGGVVRSDGYTAPLVGTVEDAHHVSVILNQACYNVPGWAQLAVRITEGDSITTLLALTMHVVAGDTDEVVDPEHVVPSLAELLAKISDMERVTADAERAAAEAERVSGPILQDVDAVKTSTAQLVEAERLKHDGALTLHPEFVNYAVSSGELSRPNETRASTINKIYIPFGAAAEIINTSATIVKTVYGFDAYGAYIGSTNVINPEYRYVRIVAQKRDNSAITTEEAAAAIHLSLTYDVQQSANVVRISTRLKNVEAVDGYKPATSVMQALMADESIRAIVIDEDISIDQPIDLRGDLEIFSETCAKVRFTNNVGIRITSNIKNASLHDLTICGTPGGAEGYLIDLLSNSGECRLCNLVLADAYAGIHVDGWVYNLHDFVVHGMDDVGVMLTKTDNAMSNFYVYGCKKQGVYIHASNNRITNFKVLGSGRECESVYIWGRRNTITGLEIQDFYTTCLLADGANENNMSLCIDGLRYNNHEAGSIVLARFNDCSFNNIEIISEKYGVDAPFAPDTIVFAYGQKNTINLISDGSVVVEQNPAGRHYVVNETGAELTQIKSDYAQQIELLKAVRDALKGGDIDGAVGLLDTYLLDKEVLA